MVCALTFVEPWRFGWLLLLPLLWWLALPPRPRRQQWTAHLPQWQAAQRALRRKPPRLSGLRFLLLALAATAAVAAHAAPRWRAGDGPDRLVVLLDGSASMAGQGAYDAAQARLRAAFATLPPHVDVTLLRCGGPRLRRHGASARALHELGTPAGSLDVDLVQLAAEVATQPHTVVWTLTDGQAQRALPSVGALATFPNAGDNGALREVAVVDHWPLPQLSVRAAAIAFTAGARRGELRVRGAVVAPAAATLELVPGVPASATFDVARTAAGGELVVELHLADDVLPADGVFRATLPPLPAPRIAVLEGAEAGPFAAAAARALAEEVGGSVVAAAPGTEVGLLLVDGGIAQVAPGRVRALCFGSRSDTDVEVVPWLAPRDLEWDRAGALTAGLDLSELRVDRAFRGLLPAGEAFLWAGDGAGGRVPLAVVCAGADVASIHFAFRLQDSNLPLLAAFPQLLRRAFVRCHGRSAAIAVTTPPPAPTEQDLRTAATGPDRPLPPFRERDRDLAGACLFGALVLLALRTLVR